MEKIKVRLTYPIEFSKIEYKDIEIDEIELNALLGSNKVGSEGTYFKIKDRIFEDTDEGISLSIELEK